MRRQTLKRKLRNFCAATAHFIIFLCGGKHACALSSPRRISGLYAFVFFFFARARAWMNGDENSNLFFWTVFFFQKCSASEWQRAHAVATTTRPPLARYHQKKIFMWSGPNGFVVVAGYTHRYTHYKEDHSDGCDAVHKRIYKNEWSTKKTLRSHLLCVRARG